MEIIFLYIYTEIGFCILRIAGSGWYLVLLNFNKFTSQNDHCPIENALVLSPDPLLSDPRSFITFRLKGWGKNKKPRTDLVPGKVMGFPENDNCLMLRRSISHRQTSPSGTLCPCSSHAGTIEGSPKEQRSTAEAFSKFIKIKTRGKKKKEDKREKLKTGKT